MTSLEKPDLVTTNVHWRWPSVHPEGRKFVVIAAADRRLVLLGDRLGLARLARRRRHDLGRRLLPRSDPHHADRARGWSSRPPTGW